MGDEVHEVDQGTDFDHAQRGQVLLQVGTRLFKLYLEVVDARRALLSVSAMSHNGWQVDFGHGTSSIRHGKSDVELKRRGGLCLVEGEVKDARLTTPGETTEVLMMPVEGIQQPTLLLEDAVEAATATQALQAQAKQRRLWTLQSLQRQEGRPPIPTMRRPRRRP